MDGEVRTAFVPFPFSVQIVINELEKWSLLLTPLDAEFFTTIFDSQVQILLFNAGLCCSKDGEQEEKSDGKEAESGGKKLMTQEQVETGQVSGETSCFCV